jgi:hypothetical protein
VKAGTERTQLCHGRFTSCERTLRIGWTRVGQGPPVIPPLALRVGQHTFAKERRSLVGRRGGGDRRNPHEHVAILVGQPTLLGVIPEHWPSRAHPPCSVLRLHAERDRGLRHMADKTGLVHHWRGRGMGVDIAEVALAAAALQLAAAALQLVVEHFSPLRGMATETGHGRWAS